MEELEGAATECGTDVDAGAIVEGGIFGLYDGAFGFCFDFGTDGCEGGVTRSGGSR